MSEIAQYYAAGLIHIAQKSSNGFVLRRDELHENFENFWSISVNPKDLSEAVRILNSCNISYMEDDKFAGRFIVVSKDGFNLFNDRVEKQLDSYNALLTAEEDIDFGISRAEAGYYPDLEKRNHYPVLKKYRAFGEEWLRTAMDEIKRRSEEHGSKVPASDRTVYFDHNSPEFVEAKATIAAAKQALSSDNEVGQALGDNREIALAEIEQIEKMIDQPRARTSLLKSYSKRSLGWIGEKSAGTILSELVKKLFEIIMGWLI